MKAAVLGVGKMGLPIAVQFVKELARRCARKKSLEDDDAVFADVALMTSCIAHTQNVCDVVQAELRLFCRENGVDDASLVPNIVAAVTPDMALRRCNVVVTCLPRSSDVHKLAMHAIDSNLLAENALWIDTTSGEPTVSFAIGEALSKRGVNFVDCGVSGGPSGAMRAELTAIMGGPVAAVNEAMPFVRSFSSKIVHVGERYGAGHAVKAVNNLLMATNLLSASYGVSSLCGAFGVPADRALAAINASSGRSWATINRLTKHVVPRTFDYGFTMELLDKDVANGLACVRAATSAAAATAPADVFGPVSSAVRASALRAPRLDHTHLAEVCEEWTGAQMKSSSTMTGGETDLTSSSTIPSRTVSLGAHGIRGVCFDMAGTTVHEGGIVYKTMKGVMREKGLTVEEDEFRKWRGANKVEVLQHFCALPVNAGLAQDAEKLFETFKTRLMDAYFRGDMLRPVVGAIDALQALRDAGILVGLQTGYATALALGIADRVGIMGVADGLVTAEDAGHGRPAPYMVFRQMQLWRMFDTKSIAKVGDTPRDMEEGRNAGCGLVIGVLSGAGSEAELLQSGADVVLPDVTHIVP